MRNIHIIQRAGLFAILLALMAVIPANTFAGTVGFFSRIEGKVDILRGGSKTPSLVSKGEAVSIGDIVRTKIDSRAEIIFKDETSVRLAPETRIKIDEYLYNPDSSRNKGAISLLRGKMRAVVSKARGGVIPVTSGSSTFNIQTPTAVAGVRGTTLFVFYQYGVTGVIFKDGSGFVLNPNNCAPSRAVNINDGQISFVMRQCAPPLQAREATGAELAGHNADTTFKADTDGTETKKDENGIIQGSDEGGGIFGYEDPQDDIEEPGSKLAQKGVYTGYTALRPVSETNPWTLSNMISAGTEDTPPVPAVDEQAGDTPQVITDEVATDNEPADSIPPDITVDIPGDNTPPFINFDGPGDNMPPVISVNGPSGVTNLSAAVFIITSNEPVTIQYWMDSLEGDVYGTPSDTLNLDAVPEGPHLLTIIATDAAGNKTTKSYSWTTDYTTPVVSINTMPPAITNSGSVSFGQTASEDSVFSYTLDGLPVAAPDFSGLSEGNHTFTVKATDTAGNVSTASYAWKVDYTAPVISLNSSPHSITNSPDANFSIGVNEDAVYLYSMDGGAWKGSSGPISLSALPEGSHTIEIKASDTAGNESSALSFTWTTDYTPPFSSFTAAPLHVSDSATANFTFASNEPSSSFYYRVDGGSWRSSDGSVSLTGPDDFGEGLHSIDILTTDQAGNNSTSSYSWFYGTRHNTMTGLASGTGSSLDGNASLDLYAVSTGNQGGWLADLSGTYSGPSADSWQIVSGGNSYTSNNLWDGYYLHKAYGTYSGNLMSGTSSLSYLSTKVLGSGSGVFSGSFDSTAGTWQATDTGIGTYTETPLSFVSEVSISQSVQTRDYTGILGGTGSLWSGDVTPVSVIGVTSLKASQPHIWSGGLSSYNYNNSTHTTYDGGAYYGFMAGTDTGNNGGIEGRLYAIYVAPDGQAGYLKGGLDGSTYPEISMFEMEGDISRREVTSDAGVASEDLHNSVWKGSGKGGISGNNFSTYSIVDFSSGKSLPWGIYYQKMGGQFSTTASDWAANMGGSGIFGIIGSTKRYYGGYSYSDGGSYSYDYFGNNKYGSKYYSRPGGEHSYTNYYSDGTTYTYNYKTKKGTYGIWDTAAIDLASLSLPPDPATAVPGSSGSYTDGTNESGYYLANAAGGAWHDGKLRGTVNGRYMTPYRIGEITGDALGIYDTTLGTWQATGAGAYKDTAPLALSASFSDYHYYIDTSYYRLDHSYADSFSGILGTTVSPFLDPGIPVALHLMGEAHPDYANNHTLWWAGVSGNNYVDTSSKWAGWLGGYTSPDNIIRGEMNGLYVDSGGSAGILLSNHFTGAYYPDAFNVWEAEGSLTAIDLATGYTAGSLTYATGNPDSYLYDTLHGTFGIGASLDIHSDSYLHSQNEMGYNISRTRRFAGELWGIYQLAFGGEFNSKPSGTAAFTMETDGGNKWFSSTLPYADTWGNYTAGTWNENNTIEGNTYGYAADTSTPAPATWISVGDTIGTYNPDINGTYGTWQAVQMGVFLETNSFLSMTQTAEGQAKLAQLNIPYAEVGRVTLTGSGNNFTDVTMADTVFLAYNSGEAPKIWATGNVSGSYTSDPALHNPVTLTGGGLAADFIPRTWDTVNGQWRSEIRGTGGFNGSAGFQGAGAGTINTGAGTISGTAAGLVK